MYKKILLFLVVITLSMIAYHSLNSRPRYWHKCMNGYLYYDWKSRPFGYTIPVLNKKMEMIRCYEK